jgi:hypothetical protein
LTREDAAELDYGLYEFGRENLWKVFPQVRNVNGVTVRNMRFANFDDMFSLKLVCLKPFIIYPFIRDYKSTVIKVDESNYLKVRHKGEVELIRVEGKLDVIVFPCLIHPSASFFFSIRDVFYYVKSTHFFFVKAFD